MHFLRHFNIAVFLIDRETAKFSCNKVIILIFFSFEYIRNERALVFLKEIV